MTAARETNASAGSVAHVPGASKILTFLKCMPAGDSKNEPHQEKKPSFFFQRGRAINMETHISSQRRQDSIAQCDAALAPLHAAPQRAPSQGKKKKKQQSKSVFSFPPEERCPSRQGKMMACALLQREGAFSAPQRAWDAGTTQQSKRNGTIGAKERNLRNNNQKVNFLFLLRRGHPSQPRKDDGAWRLLSASARMGWDNTTIKIMVPWLIFHFHL